MGAVIVTPVSGEAASPLPGMRAPTKFRRPSFETVGMIPNVCRPGREIVATLPTATVRTTVRSASS